MGRMKLTDEPPYYFDSCRPIHQCSVCGYEGQWNQSWRWYGSYQEMENAGFVYRFCSPECAYAFERNPDRAVKTRARWIDNAEQEAR